MTTVTAKPIKDIQPLRYSIIEKDKKKLPEGVLLRIGGVFQRAEAENANKRVYPRQLWQEVLQRPDVVERIENRRMAGMLGHPASGETDPEKISHIVVKQELRSDNTIYGEADIVDTPQGRIAEALFRAGFGWGISSRGNGSIEKKGDKNEVQNDYGLETYDLVVKPSTLGAYPGMLAEGVDVASNEKMVAEVIDGLVNSSNIPDDQRVGVLIECLKILSVLEAENSGDRIKTLSAKIQEELKPQPLITVQANESIQPGFNPNPPEDNMPQNGNNQGSPQQSQMSHDTLTWHQSQVNHAVGMAVAAKEQEISQLKDTVIKAQREHTETKRRLRAAESLIEGFTAKIQELETAGPADENLKKRYAAAVELLDEALKRLPEIGQLSTRTKTLEGLLQASIDSVNEGTLKRCVSEHLAKVDASYHDTIRPVLENCTTVEQVAETFKALVAVSRGVASQSREPLPPRQPANESVQGGTPPPQPAQRSGGVVSLLGRRLKSAV